MNQRFNRLIINFLTLATVMAGLFGCGPSSEQKEMAKNECERFMQEKFERYTHVFDLWSKEGKIVVEVGYKDAEWKDEYSVRLCVVDVKNGSISIPSVFNAAQWAK